MNTKGRKPATVTHYTYVEGGVWYKWNPRQPPSYVYAIKLSNGWTWCCAVGWRNA